MTTTRQDYRDWLGRTDVRSDILTPSAIARLLTTLDRPPQPDGPVDLRAAYGDGGLLMRATATLAEGS